MRFVLKLMVCLFITSTQAQTYEIGLWAGGSNMIGDVGSTRYVNPTDLAVGGIAKWNRSSRHSFRGSLILTRASADDDDSSDVSRQLRGLSYNYYLLEASLGIEYNFWDWDVYAIRPQFTPYMYTGITGISYGVLERQSISRLEQYDRKIQVGVPFILGAKYKVLEHFVVGAEVGVRYNFTDNLDGSSPDGEFEDRSQLKFGNENNNDWYVFSGITVTYTFGRKPCYCNF